MPMFQQFNRVDECGETYLKGGIPAVSMGISGRCNLRCLYCSENAGKKKADETSPAEKTVMLNKFKKAGLKSMAFCFYGEPSLDPAFWPMVEWCGKNNVQLYSFSNLTQITSLALAKKLLDNNVTIAGKMDRLMNFDDLLGVKGSSQKTLRGLSYLLEAGYPVIKKAGEQTITNLSIVFVPTKLNYKEVTRVAEKCKSLNIFLRVGALEKVGRAEDNSDSLYLPKKELEWVYNEISRIYEYDYKSSYSHYCLGILGAMIDIDGSVFVDQYGLSCHFVMPRDMAVVQKNVIGNAVTDSIEEIWNKIEKIRVDNVYKLEKLVKDLEKRNISGIGCSGRTDKMLKKALELIKTKHRLQ